MGKPTGFLEYDREVSKAVKPHERIKNFNEFHTPLSRDHQQEQAARCMECGVPFCQSGMTLMGMTSGCPLHNLVPEWNDLVYTGNWKQAYNRLKKTNNFPEFTGRVCPALCEAACTCGLHGDPVCTKENELSIIEYAYQNGYADPKPPRTRTGKKVAVIGSGHSVTVFERSDRPGGLLRYGIPNMKLEKRFVERKIDVMKQEGITFVTNAEVGGENPEYAASRIMEKFDRVVLACGSANARNIDVPGRDASGIYFAVDYLKSATKSLLDANMEIRKAAKNWISARDKNVVIIGGGDTGNDCVGTAIRQGAKNVIQIEMMPKAPDKRTESNPWPEWPRVCKVDYGQEEAIDQFGKDPRIYETTVKEFIRNEKGELTAVKTIKLHGEVDKKTGRRVMKEIEGTEQILPAELVLIAAGFLGCEKRIADAFGVELNARTNVNTEAGKYQTNVPHVFTAGDMHRGQSLVVWAIREGREAAREVDESLMGYSNLGIQ